MTSFLSSWILSIIGIIFVGVLSDIIIPNGKMKNIVKTVVSLFVILTVISPIKFYDVSKLNLFNFDLNSIYTDSTFIKTNEETKIERLKIDIENTLKENGYKDITIEIKVGENNKINTIYVDLTSLVLFDESMNINKYTNIIAIIKQFVGIDREHIVFYE